MTRPATASGQAGGVPRRSEPLQELFDNNCHFEIFWRDRYIYIYNICMEVSYNGVPKHILIRYPELYDILKWSTQIEIYPYSFLNG